MGRLGGGHVRAPLLGQARAGGAAVDRWCRESWGAGACGRHWVGAVACGRSHAPASGLLMAEISSFLLKMSS